MNRNNKETPFAQAWFWIMEVMFGGIAVLTFRKAYITISDIGYSWSMIGLIPVFVFYLYHVGVYNYLTKAKGLYYRTSWSSYVRYLMDFGLAGLLFFITHTGIEVAFNIDSIIPIRLLLWQLLIWHSVVFVWHILALSEQKINFRKILEVNKIWFHLIGIGVYSLIILGYILFPVFESLVAPWMVSSFVLFFLFVLATIRTGLFMNQEIKRN